MVTSALPAEEEKPEERVPVIPLNTSLMPPEVSKIVEDRNRTKRKKKEKGEKRYRTM